MINLESNYAVNKCHGRLQNQSRKGNRGKFKVSKGKKNVYETSEVPCIFFQMSMSTELEIYKVTLDYLIIIIKT